MCSHSDIILLLVKYFSSREKKVLLCWGAGVCRGNSKQDVFGGLETWSLCAFSASNRPFAITFWQFLNVLEIALNFC